MEKTKKKKSKGQRKKKYKRKRKKKQGLTPRCVLSGATPFPFFSFCTFSIWQQTKSTPSMHLAMALQYQSTIHATVSSFWSHRRTLLPLTYDHRCSCRCGLDTHLPTRPIHNNKRETSTFWDKGHQKVPISRWLQPFDQWELSRHPGNFLFFYLPLKSAYTVNQSVLHADLSPMPVSNANTSYNNVSMQE